VVFEWDTPACYGSMRIKTVDRQTFALVLLAFTRSINRRMQSDCGPATDRDLPPKRGDAQVVTTAAPPASTC